MSVPHNFHSLVHFSLLPQSPALFCPAYVQIWAVLFLSRTVRAMSCFRFSTFSSTLNVNDRANCTGLHTVIFVSQFSIMIFWTSAIDLFPVARRVHFPLCEHTYMCPYPHTHTHALSLFHSLSLFFSHTAHIAILYFVVFSVITPFSSTDTLSCSCSESFA